jgi:Protein of unknown function (DUF1217)
MRRSGEPAGLERPMSGIVSGIDYGVLFSGSQTVTNATTAMLNALYSGGTASASSAVSSGDPLTDLKLAQANETADVAKEARQPLVARDIAAFKQAVGNAKDIRTALSNPAVLKVLLTSNGLGSQVQYTGLATKVLMSDPSDPNSLVSKLNNSSWTAVAKTFNFAQKGLSALTDPRVIDTLTNGYAEVMWRRSLDQATPGLANALAFLKQASSIKTVDDILGDPVNRAVVTTALGIPQEIAFQELRAQETAISSRLDVSKLQDAKFVASLTDQYLLTMKQSGPSNGVGTSLEALAMQAGSLLV